jgi:hypothetical protein
VDWTVVDVRDSMRDEQRLEVERLAKQLFPETSAMGLSQVVADPVRP